MSNSEKKRSGSAPTAFPPTSAAAAAAFAAGFSSAVYAASSRVPMSRVRGGCSFRRHPADPPVLADLRVRIGTKNHVDAVDSASAGPRSCTL